MIISNDHLERTGWTTKKKNKLTKKKTKNNLSKISLLPQIKSLLPVSLKNDGNGTKRNCSDSVYRHWWVAYYIIIWSGDVDLYIILKDHIFQIPIKWLNMVNLNKLIQPFFNHPKWTVQTRYTLYDSNYHHSNVRALH